MAIAQIHISNKLIRNRHSKKGETVKNMSVRYKIIPNVKYGDVIIFDAETGSIQHPVCWQDLLAYYNYLVGQGRIDESQKLLAESVAGKKPITKMLAHAGAATH